MDNFEILENWENVKYRMNEEGFHYCFMSYSKWDEIEDKEFHKLRKRYLKVSKQLQYYVDSKIDEFRDLDY